MDKPLYKLTELAHYVGKSVEDLVCYGADDKLTIQVIADNWPVKPTGEGSQRTEKTVDGQVALLAADLLKALGADFTTVRQVRTGEGEIVTLEPAQKVLHGIHYVTAAERDRLREALKPTPQPTVAASKDALPPYLDPSHKYYSDTLEAAVSAWMALYTDRGFKKRSHGHKLQIKSWLKKHRPDKVKSDYARKNIATVVNPNKVGGNPLIKKR